MFFCNFVQLSCAIDYAMGLWDPSLLNLFCSLLLNSICSYFIRLGVRYPLRKMPYFFLMKPILRLPSKRMTVNEFTTSRLNSMAPNQNRRPN